MASKSVESKKYLKITFEHVVEIQHVSITDILERLQETGTGRVTDMEVIQLTDEEYRKLPSDFPY